MNKTAKIVVAVVALLIAIPVGSMMFAYHWFTGENGEEHTRDTFARVWDQAVDDDVRDQVRSNEQTVRETLLTIERAQVAHKERHRRYADNLWELELPADLQNASLDGPSEQGYLGYRFGQVPMDGALAINSMSQFAVCAVPSIYRYTGIHTYVLDTEGRMVRRDNWGTAVENTVELMDKNWTETAAPSETPETP